MRDWASRRPRRWRWGSWSRVSSSSSCRRQRRFSDGARLSEWWVTFANARAFTQPWRWITYQYLHHDAMHIFFNLIGMYFSFRRWSMWGGRATFCSTPPAESRQGALWDHQPVHAVRAPADRRSGSIFAMLGAMALFFRRCRSCCSSSSRSRSALAVLLAILWVLLVIGSHDPRRRHIWAGWYSIRRVLREGRVQEPGDEIPPLARTPATGGGEGRDGIHRSHSPEGSHARHEQPVARGEEDAPARHGPTTAAGVRARGAATLTLTFHHPAHTFICNDVRRRPSAVHQPFVQSHLLCGRGARRLHQVRRIARHHL